MTFPKEKILEVKSTVRNILGWDEGRAWVWLTTSRPKWDFRSPIEMIIAGEYAKVDAFVKDTIKVSKLITVT